MIERGQALSVVCPESLVVRCVSGTAWITIAGDVRDIVLEPGQRLQARRGDRLFINGMPRCVLCVDPAAAECDRPRIAGAGRRRARGCVVR